MSIYLLSFFLSCLLTNLANKFFLNNKKIKGIILSALAILVISIVAGVRDYSIGTDINTYGNITFYSARNNDFFTFFTQNILGAQNIEPLYLCLNYIIALFTDNPHWLYFIIQLIITTLVYIRLLDYKDEKILWIGMLVFQCFFLGDSYNLLRQSLAMAIVFWCSRYIEKYDFKKYILAVLMASLFHSTAIIGSIFYIIYWLLNKNKSKIFFQIIIVVCVIGAMISYQELVAFLISMGLITTKLSRYISSSVTFSFNPFLLRIVVILLILLFYKSYKKKSDFNIFLFTILICEIILSQFRTVSVGLFRISIYFSYFKIIAYPMLVSSLNFRNNKKLIKYILILFCIIVWYYQTVLQGNNDVYPYTSQILGIK